MAPSIPTNAVPALAKDSPAVTAATQAASKPEAKTGEKTEISLSIETSIFYDSDVQDGRWSPGAGADPNAPEPTAAGKQDEIGHSASASASLRMPLDNGARLEVDASVYGLEFDGSENDEAAAYFAAGFSSPLDEKTRFLIQLTASGRWYGDELSTATGGVRTQLSHDLGGRQKIVLTVDTSWLASECGESLSGRELAGSLAYQTAIGSSAYLMLGAYARRDWLRSKEFSSWDAGGYASAMLYLGEHLRGGVTMGAGHIELGPGSAYDFAPRRADWTLFGSIYLATRKPLFLGISPYIDYGFRRRWSAIPALSTDHSRLRLSLRRQF